MKKTAVGILIAIAATFISQVTAEAPNFQEDVLVAAQHPQATPEMAPNAGLVESNTQKCAQLNEKREQLSNAHMAAETLHSSTSDKSMLVLMSTYQKLLQETQAQWVVSCVQSEQDVAEIARAVKKKELAMVTEAAHAGLMAAEAAVQKQRQAAEQGSKATAEKSTKAAALKKRKQVAAKQQATQIAKEMKDKERERLLELPQITQDLYGMVKDGSTGKAISNAKITAICVFKTTAAQSRDNGKFTLSEGISGPSGHSCKLQVQHDDYANTEFDIAVMKVTTGAIFRQAVLMPKIEDKERFRFVLSYESGVPMMSAHVLVPMEKGQHADVSNRKLRHFKTNFVGHGSSKRSPFVLMDLHTPPPGFGPEAYSIHRVKDGVYHFVVANDAHRFTTAADFATSGARAYLFQGNEMLATAAIDTATKKRTHTWNVFSLSCAKAVCSAKTTNSFLVSSSAAF